VVNHLVKCVQRALTDCNVFSERKLAFTFAICRRPSVCHLYVCL